MKKIDVLNEIDNKIETYQKRIDTRKNKACYFDESKRMQEFKNRIESLEEAREWVSKVD